MGYPACTFLPSCQQRILNEDFEQPPVFNRTDDFQTNFMRVSYKPPITFGHLQRYNSYEIGGEEVVFDSQPTEVPIWNG